MAPRCVEEPRWSAALQRATRTAAAATVALVPAHLRLARLKGLILLYSVARYDARLHRCRTQRQGKGAPGLKKG